jgi:hypothetical protein
MSHDLEKGSMEGVGESRQNEMSVIEDSEEQIESNQHIELSKRLFLLFVSPGVSILIWYGRTNLDLLLGTRSPGARF